MWLLFSKRSSSKASGATVLFVALSLSGCRFVAVDKLDGSSRAPTPASIELTDQNPVPAVVMSTTGFAISWQASGDEDFISVQESTDGVTWSEITSVSTLSGTITIDPDDISLPDGEIEFRLQLRDEFIGLGSARVDRSPPVLATQFPGGMANGVFIGCGPALSSFVAATDNLSASGDIIYVSDEAAAAGLTNCLNGTNSRQCNWDLSPLPPTINYKAIDEAGNETSGTLQVDACA